jgi:hypothetical protein
VGAGWASVSMTTAHSISNASQTPVCHVGLGIGGW